MDYSTKLRVFVYGTLKPGEANYQTYCAKKIIRTERVFTFGTLYALPVGYPAMTWGRNPVYGYLYEFDDATVLNHLDELEDYDPSGSSGNNLYNRYKIEIFRFPEGENPTIIPLQSLGYTWAYLMDSEQVEQLGGKLLPDGWWSGCNLTMKS